MRSGFAQELDEAARVPAPATALLDLNWLVELEFSLSFFEGETRVRSATAAG